jgi:hypothetical protein
MKKAQICPQKHTPKEVMDCKGPTGFHSGMIADQTVSVHSVNVTFTNWVVNVILSIFFTVQRIAPFLIAQNTHMNEKNIEKYDISNELGKKNENNTICANVTLTLSMLHVPVEYFTFCLKKQHNFYMN